jgi:hypothetical protein
VVLQCIMLCVAILELWTKVSWWGKWKEQGGFGESDGVYEYKFVLVDDNFYYMCRKYTCCIEIALLYTLYPLAFYLWLYVFDMRVSPF